MEANYPSGSARSKRDVTPWGVRYFAAFVLVALVFCAAPAPTSAHEGHDVVAPVAAASIRHSLPRLFTNSENYELVAVLDGLRLRIYLDRFQDNTPVTDANITVMINQELATAELTKDGSYSVASRQFGSGGLLEFVFDITAPEADDLLIGKLLLANDVLAGPASFPIPWYVQAGFYLRHGAEDHLVLMSLVLLTGLALGMGLHHVRVLPVIMLAVPAVVGAPMDRAALADEGHALQDNQAATPGDVSRRLPDGKIFIPKPTQRILDVRTVIARPETVPTTAVFVGRIIADPNRSGLVQSINGGRVIAAAQGLPGIGQAIAKGDVLASVEPPMAMADRTTLSERIGELEQLIAVAEAKLQRLRPMAERQVVPQSLVIETEAELEGLYRRRDIVRETRVAPEVLRSPADGVIAMSRVVAGQVVQAQDVLFQVIDPNSLWVEAYDYGANDPAMLRNATAIGSGNVALKLGFQGWSRTLQQQATVLRFAIADPPPSILVGQPVTVTAERGESINGIIVDRDAIVRDGNGEDVVWCHVEPEYFAVRRVRTQPFDATRVLIAAGIEKGERIVVRGAELINQIR